MAVHWCWGTVALRHTHRDNTLEAFHLASDHGADGVEFDVRFAADDQPIVHHDAVIPGFGALINHRLSDIRKALPYIPMLDEVLAVPTSLLLNMGIKNHLPTPTTTPTIASPDSSRIGSGRMATDDRFS